MQHRDRGASTIPPTKTEYDTLRRIKGNRPQCLNVLLVSRIHLILQISELRLQDEKSRLTNYPQIYCLDKIILLKKCGLIGQLNRI